MKTLLLIAPQPGFAEAIRAMVDAQRYRVIHCREPWEAEPILSQAGADVCLLEADLTSVQPIRVIEGLRQRLPHCPIIVCAGARQWEWEEEACVQGVTHVLAKPVRARWLNLVLDRLPESPALPAASEPTPRSQPAPLSLAPPPHPGSSETLGVLRDFSAILAHSLQAEPLLREFLLRLREILGVNRAAVFLRQPPALLRDPAAFQTARHLRACCAIGLPADLLGHFGLSLDSGIGGYVFRSGRILRRHSPETERDLGMQKEFELVGAEVAVPILDRENLVGVALFDGRITGEPLENGELGLIFHLLEELGMAIRNIWLHDQVMSSNDMMGDILRQLHSACLVVGWDLSVLHANEAALAQFGRADRKGLPLEFTNLPQVLGSKVFEVLKTGRELRLFKYATPPPDSRSFRVTITPFRKQNFTTPSAALVLVEDCTDEDRVHGLEIEAASLRLVKTMAERLSHEVGNALVPLSTHQQLFTQKKDDPEFMESLETALDAGVRRVSRLSSQMLYLARDLPSRIEPIPLDQLLNEAFREAQRHEAGLAQALVYENGAEPVVVQGDRASLRHALSEVLLNALQANPKEARLTVQSSTHSDEKGRKWVDIEIRDRGPGFTAQALQQAAEPFFTTRNVGLGLGLTVCRKIVEVHKGRLELGDPEHQPAGVVRISLPLVPRPEPAAAR